MSQTSTNTDHPQSGVWITAYGSCSALGLGLSELRMALTEGRTGLSTQPRFPEGLGPFPFPACVGVVSSELAPAPRDHVFPDTRQLRLAWETLRPIEAEVQSAVARVGSERVALILGTSTGGIASTEEALVHFRKYGQLPSKYSCLEGHTMDAAARHVAAVFDIRGPVFATSSACASGAKALASAKRLIELGVVDVVLAGGIDSLARMTIQGFHSLGVLSSEPCRPFSESSGGMNVAEGGSWLLVERSTTATDRTPLVSLVGVGESSDAYHMSAPDPTGQSQGRAMSKALSDARLTPSDIMYINAHGTGTRANDSAEHAAISAVFGEVPASSTKHIIGHQLGAAGATEAVIAAEVARGLPLSPIGAIDERRFPLPKEAQQRHVLSNSFAFGGANISLLLSSARVETCAPPLAPGLCARVRAMSTLSTAPTFGAISSGQPSPEPLDLKTAGGSLLGPRGRARASELTRLLAEGVSRLDVAAAELAKMPIFIGSALGQIQTSKELIELFLNGDASPLAFQGSVHNTAAGVLTIALKNNEPSSSIAGGDDTLFCTLLEAMSYLDEKSCPEVLVLVGDETPPPELGLPHFPTAVMAMVLTHPRSLETGPLLEIRAHRTTDPPAPHAVVSSPKELEGHICGEGPGLVKWLLDTQSQGQALVMRRRPQSPWQLWAHHPSSKPASLVTVTLDKLVPHRPPLMLLDQVLAYDETHIACSVDPRANMIFADEAGIDAVVTTEWMAQAIGAFVGQKKRLLGGDPRMGFIIGIRKVDFHAPKVKNAADIIVTASPLWADHASGSFHCTVKNMITNELIAEGA